MSICLSFVLCFFFFKQKTAYEMRISDWSSDVCSSDLLYIRDPSAALMYWHNRSKSLEAFQGPWLKSGDKYTCDADGYYTYAGRSDDKIGRASCRERVCQYV